jgi:TMEM175 potassium channel family protein
MGAPTYVAKHRFEAFADGIYAIAVTLLVLDLKLPRLAAGAPEQALTNALIDVVPNALVWLLSFWVMAMFWLGQQRVYRLPTALDGVLIVIELAQLALISLLPFSTALIGAYGSHIVASATYSTHLLIMSLLSLARVHHLRRHGELLATETSKPLLRESAIRAWMIVGCASGALALAFFIPRWNMLAMVPVAFSRWVVSSVAQWPALEGAAVDRS